MKPCIKKLLERTGFLEKHEWTTARNLIVKDLRAEGWPPDDIKRELVRWGKDTRNLTTSKLKNELVDFVAWHVKKEPVPQPITCAPTGKMAQMGWCLGDECEYRQQRRREANERRAGISPERLGKWKDHLIREEKHGYYIAAVYDAIRMRWLDLDLADGDPVYIGLRDIAQAATDAVNRLPRRAKTKADCKKARWAIGVLESYHLIRVLVRGRPGLNSGRANGYLLLPLAEPPGAAV